MQDIYQIVTDKIVAMIESADHGEWRMPWHTNAIGMQPQNIDGRPYRGINVWLLLSEGRSSNVWGTYKAWQAKKAFVRKGEKATLVIYWNQAKKQVRNEDTGELEVKSYLIAKGYPVFNSEQVEGYTPKELPAPTTAAERIEHAEAFFRTQDAIVNHGGSRAYYSPMFDAIQMPEFEAFKDAEAYYATLAHEFTHWTGAKSRCNRELGQRFGDNAYAMEELVAELGSAYICAALELTNEPRPDHAAYLANWLKVLKGDKRAIFTAASKAQAAADYLLKQEPEEQAMAA